MYIHIYIYIYVYMSLCLCLCVYIYICLYIYIYIDVPRSTYIIRYVITLYCKFKYQNITAPCKKGLTLIWPTDFTHTHSGQISETHEKYIITGWFGYEKSLWEDDPRNAKGTNVIDNQHF